jgi:SAM-dependent methyltransferase
VDVGCGQGHFLTYCTLMGFQSLVGLDPSLRGLRRAQSILPGTVVLIQARAEELPVRFCQGIVVLDVLYLLDRQKQESFLARAAAVLPPQGRLLIKTMAPEKRIRQRINRLQEHIAVKMLRITLGDAFQFRTREDWVSLCERNGFQAEVIPLWTGYLHPHVLVVATRTTEQVHGPNHE